MTACGEKGRDTAGGILLLDEEHLEEQMNTIVEPYLERIVRRGIMPSQLYYELYPLPEEEGHFAGGTVVISHGFTESCRKYHEWIYYLLKAGYSCAIMDHRGHGNSLREGADPDVVHVMHFDTYAKDLHEFVHGVVMPELTKGNKDSLFLYAHSMGGCIGARYMQLYPGDFARAVLNSPMLGLKTEGCPSWAAALLCDICILAGKGEYRLFSQGPFDPQEPFEKGCASSRARHEYYQKLRRSEKALQTSSASYRWVREALRAGYRACSRRETGKIGIPVLLFQAGQYTLVSGSAQRNFICRVKNGELVKVDGSRHEIYRCANRELEAYLRRVIEFFDMASINGPFSE